MPSDQHDDMLWTVPHICDKNVTSLLTNNKHNHVLLCEVGQRFYNAIDWLLQLL